MADKWQNVCSNVNTCALNGASNFFAGIPNAHVISNAPLWCYFYSLRYLEKSHVDLDNRFQCTQLDNSAVVYGTEKSLLKTIDLVNKLASPDLLAIENSCAISLIGDDLAGIARKANLNYPIIDLDTGGLIGGFNEGYNLACKKFFEKIELNSKNKIKAKHVNLLGCTPGHFNAANDLRELKTLLHKAGYKIVAIPGAGSSLAEIKNMEEAELNIVVNPELGLELAKFLEDKYQMPYINIGLPYGITGTMQWLEQIKQVIDTDLSALINEAKILEKNTIAAIGELKGTWGELWFDTAIVAAPSAIALNIANALRLEWVDMDKLIVITHDKTIQLGADSQADLVLESSSQGREVEDVLSSISDNSIFLGSGIEKATIMRKNIRPKAFCNIAFPVHDEVILNPNPFVGINGAVNLLEKIWNQKINNLMNGY